MFLAYKLHKPEAEIGQMTIEEFATWAAFFRIVEPPKRTG